MSLFFGYCRYLLNNLRSLCLSRVTVRVLREGDPPPPLGLNNVIGEVFRYIQVMLD